MQDVEKRFKGGWIVKDITKPLICHFRAFQTRITFKIKLGVCF